MTDWNDARVDVHFERLVDDVRPAWLYILREWAYLSRLQRERERQFKREMYNYMNQTGMDPMEAMARGIPLDE